MSHRRALPLLCGLLLASSGCFLRAGRGPRGMSMPETVITGDASLAKMNDEELFAAGTASFAGGDFARAAVCFGRIVDFFPQSPHVPKALYNAGLSHERMKNWEAAYERFKPLADPAHGQGDALDASFRLAETLYQLGRYTEAQLLLRTLASRTDLPTAQRIEAQVQQGICELEGGAPETAESTLRKVLEAYQVSPDHDGIDGYFPAQAQFFLGEIYRLRYEGSPLPADEGVDKLSDALELKAELLLSAQGHYLRSIRMGNGYWATAAGTQIGGLYEDLYHRMVDAPLPRELSAEEAAVYREELRRKIRVLLTKGISVYETTLEAAERIGTQGPFIERCRQSVHRMKELLLADTQSAPPSAEQPPPAKSSPRKVGTGSLEPHSER